MPISRAKPVDPPTRCFAASKGVLMTARKHIFHARASSYVDAMPLNAAHDARMKTVGQRIRHLRSLLQLRQEDFAARLGVTRGAVGNWELDKGIKQTNVVAIAEIFAVSPDWLWLGRGAPPDGIHADIGSGDAEKKTIEQPVIKNNANASQPLDVVFPARRLPVYGNVVGGSDGRFVLNGTQIDSVLCLPSLEGVEDAYAVYVHGESMEPRYYAGDTVYVHPHLPVRRGNFCVVQIRDEVSGDPPLGYIKRFVTRTDKELVLEQLNPPDGGPREMRFSADLVVSVHRIVGSVDG